jgi:hypothetical protein
VALPTRRRFSISVLNIVFDYINKINVACVIKMGDEHDKQDLYQDVRLELSHQFNYMNQCVI